VEALTFAGAGFKESFKVGRFTFRVKPLVCEGWSPSAAIVKGSELNNGMFWHSVARAVCAPLLITMKKAWCDPFRVESVSSRLSVGWRPRLFMFIRFADGKTALQIVSRANGGTCHWYCHGSPEVNNVNSRGCNPRNMSPIITGPERAEQ
jgi:hypothetical protein